MQKIVIKKYIFKFHVASRMNWLITIIHGFRYSNMYCMQLQFDIRIILGIQW